MDSTGRLAIPLSPKNIDMKIGNWNNIGMTLEKGLILWSVIYFCISAPIFAASYMSPLFRASVYLACKICSPGPWTESLAAFCWDLTTNGNTQSLTMPVTEIKIVARDFWQQRYFSFHILIIIVAHHGTSKPK